ncbi:hypothetical protein SEA_STUFF_16 [Streptomyces phage Stuff]|nr:hypothetical protein SEA_STUFF_16 [Streptomyces phage Stuff]
MASGDKILEFTALPVGANNSAAGITGNNPSAPVLCAIQRLTLGSDEVAATPSGGAYRLAGPVELVVQKDTSGSVNAVTLFDSSKTYKVTITEV